MALEDINRRIFLTKSNLTQAFHYPQFNIVGSCSKSFPEGHVAIKSTRSCYRLLCTMCYVAHRDRFEIVQLLCIYCFMLGCLHNVAKLTLEKFGKQPNLIKTIQ